MNDSIFELKLNPERITRIRQVLSLTKWMFIAGIVEGVVLLADAYWRALRTPSVEGNDGFYFLYLKYIYPGYATIYMIVALLMLFNFYRFSSKSHQSIAMQDTDLFNLSYRHLVNGFRYFLIALSLNIAIVSLIFLIEYFYFT